METPKLRYLLLAKLRGLVQPGYPYGIASLVQEDLILQGIRYEIESEALKLKFQMLASIIGAMNPTPEAVESLLDRSYNLYKNIRIGNLKNLGKAKGVDLSKKIYEALEAKGIIK